MELLERDDALEVLEDRLRSVTSAGGRCVVIAGEAGIGKTSLLKAFAARRGTAQLWWGDCIALQTPHPLAPLHDIARSAARLRPLLRPGVDRAGLFEGCLTELEQSGVPTLIVVEDVHWADEATLDFLVFLGRRIDRVSALLVLSYRDDEVPPSHPLRRLLGGLPAGVVTRLDVARLSGDAVDELARRAFRAPAGIHAATLGNPFFVSELIRHGNDGIPRSVEDLVLARSARLDPQARQLVELVSVVPARIERRLVDRLVEPSTAVIDTCLNSGLLVAGDATLAFRHELARVAVENSLSGPTLRALHARILAALVEEGATVPPARLAHHARRAGDAESVRRFAPAAALDAQRSDAHREAAAHYRAALECAGDATDVTRSGWFDAYATECVLIGDLDEAISARLRLDAIHRRSGEDVERARNLSQLALIYVTALRNADAHDASRTAIALLEGSPAGIELAMAYRVEAHLLMLNRDCAASIAWSRKAIATAEQFGDERTLAAARGTLGTAMLFVDYEAGRSLLERVAADALTGKQYATGAGIMTNLGSGSGEVFRLREARRYLVEAIAIAQQHEFDSSFAYATAWLALCEFYLGLWDDASRRACDALARTATQGISRVMALLAVGRVHTRRGDARGAAVLDEALELARASKTLQRVAPVRAARAEAAFLRGDLAAVVEEAGAALHWASEHQHPWFAGELAYWMHRAGALEAIPAVCAEPFALELAGRHRDAGAAWAALGCPYEQARALAGGDADDRRSALASFDALGARFASDQLRRTLRAAGARIPRGERASTRANLHQLTIREMEVLVLLCDGLKNAQIAHRLSRSVRTVDHHVAAAFAKLGVSSRAEAVSAALRAGIGSQNGQPDRETR